ncbi:MAG: ATP-binding protein [Desulfobacteraceae bacterium]
MEKDRLDKQKRKKEGIIILFIIAAVFLLTLAETRITGFGEGMPFSSSVLIFILINVNLLLLLFLLILVFRNLAKLYYEKKNKLLGTKLKTRLTAAFVTLSLLPTTVLFFFSIHFISSSIEFWFNTPVEKTLDSSLAVGQKLYEFIEEKNLFFAKRAASQIHSRNLLEEENNEKLTRYVQVVQRAFNQDAVEVYTPEARRIALSLANELEHHYFGILSSDELTITSKDRRVRTISRESPAGELLRTITAVPFDAEPEKARAFIVISSRVAPELSENLASISKGYEEYQQLKMAKKPVQTSNYIALSIVALLVVFCAIWFGFHLAESITVPLMKFAEGTQRVTKGDLNYKIDFETDDEIGTLIDSFNKMTRELATGREQLALSEKKMKQQNIELEKSRKYMEIVLRNISAGVITMDNKGTITTINKAAESMLGIKGNNMLNRRWKDMLKGEHYNAAQAIAERISPASEKMEFPLSISIDGTPRYFSIHYNTLKDDADQIIGAVMVFDDLTELEKAQRTAAWREVARRIAHEVKNPLTPIKLSAQRLKKKYGSRIQEEVFNNCTDTITEHVDLIRNLVNQFSTFARFPEINFQTCRVEKIITETAALYREGLPHVDIRQIFKEDIPHLKLDPQHMKQAFINLFDNAISAMNNKGTITVEVSYDSILKLVTIEVADDGKGISDAEKTKLFEPYFSTKKSGMGLGLAIVNSVIKDHNGSIRVQDNKPAGAKFIIELPA